MSTCSDLGSGQPTQDSPSAWIDGAYENYEDKEMKDKQGVFSNRRKLGKQKRRNLKVWWGSVSVCQRDHADPSRPHDVRVARSSQ